MSELLDERDMGYSTVRAVAVLDGGDHAAIWTLGGGIELGGHSLAVAANGVTAMCSAGPRFLTAHENRDLVLRGLPRGAREHSWKLPHACTVLAATPTAIAFAASGELSVLDWSTGQIFTRPAHAAEIRVLAFSREGRVLLSGDAAGKAIAWRMPDLSRADEWELDGAITAMAVVPKTGVAAVACREALWVRDTESASERGAIAFLPDGHVLAVGEGTWHMTPGPTPIDVTSLAGSASGATLERMLRKA